MKTLGYVAHSSTSSLEAFHFERRALRANDVAIKIHYSGICHSDLHQVKNDWGFSQYPMVPGHEIVGEVIDVGSDVKKHRVGDHVAIGCLVDSCQTCDQCQKGEEQFCREGGTQTYNSPDRVTGELTMGGYSTHIVAREEFVLSVSDKLELSNTAPILCAGITTYSPLRQYNVGPNSRVGVIGLGGLGHMAVKLAKAMGAVVTVITHKQEKIEHAKSLGADTIVLSTNDSEIEAAANSLDIIINTVPVKHDVTPYFPLLDVFGTLVMVGQIGALDEPNTAPMIFGNRRMAGSLIGGIAQTQELLDFCAEHQIYPNCELIRLDQVNEAFSRLEKGKVAHRLVIDMATAS